MPSSGDTIDCHSAFIITMYHLELTPESYELIKGNLGQKYFNKPLNRIIQGDSGPRAVIQLPQVCRL
jgi:hypothetical protein